MDRNRTTVSFRNLNGAVSVIRVEPEAMSYDFPVDKELKCVFKGKGRVLDVDLRRSEDGHVEMVVYGMARSDYRVYLGDKEIGVL